MFDISESHVLESTDEPSPAGGDDDVVATLRYNQTEPDVIRDGVDIVEIVDETDGDGERYRISYSGYLRGTIVVTRSGLEELGRSLLGSNATVPRWLLSPGDGGEESLWWVPDGYDPADTVECSRCGSDVGVDEVVTPAGDREAVDEYCCRDCWERF